MSLVETGYAIVRFLARRRFRELIKEAADQVTERVASEEVAAEEDHVDQQDEGAYADAEAVWKPEGLPDIVSQQAPEDDGYIHKVAMDVLEDEREGSFSEIFLPRLAHGAGDGV